MAIPTIIFFLDIVSPKRVVGKRPGLSTQGKKQWGRTRVSTSIMFFPGPISYRRVDTASRRPRIPVHDLTAREPDFELTR
ncbi:hypothetical protein N7492_002946 [Penicillium capsulatum]|uniref:Uncharacterized protein n=1 Tax=Penicillium capsulatum TaxID=69766 RepID=A0A9W9IMA2_9EURO|nr:hypothetical protein N7492_002946 [Penicillium capsulatum]